MAQLTVRRKETSSCSDDPSASAIIIPYDFFSSRSYFKIIIHLFKLSDTQHLSTTNFSSCVRTNKQTYFSKSISVALQQLLPPIRPLLGTDSLPHSLTVRRRMQYHLKLDSQCVGRWGLWMVRKG